MEPSLTVVMTVYNERETFLREAIESILGQTQGEFEFLIVNDGSTDPEVSRILSEYANKDARVRILENPQNLGLTASLNSALREAKGRYIARIDSDDVALPERIEKQRRFFEHYPHYVLCGTWAYLIDDFGRITGHKKSPTSYQNIRKNLLYYNFFTHSSLMFRKDTALEANGYDPHFPKAQDYELILRLSGRAPVAILPEFLCRHRLHNKSISSRSKKRQEWYALKARWNAVSRYGYPLLAAWKILPGLIYFIGVPSNIEKKILNFFHRPT